MPCRPVSNAFRVVLRVDVGIRSRCLLRSFVVVSRPPVLPSFPHDRAGLATYVDVNHHATTVPPYQTVVRGVMAVPGYWVSFSYFSQLVVLSS
jgi:hypothetical protein